MRNYEATADKIEIVIQEIRNVCCVQSTNHTICSKRMTSEQQNKVKLIISRSKLSANFICMILGVKKDLIFIPKNRKKPNNVKSRTI